MAKKYKIKKEGSISPKEMQLSEIEGFTSGVYETYDLITDYGVTADVSNFIDEDLMTDEEKELFGNMKYQDFNSLASGNYNQVVEDNNLLFTKIDKSRALSEARRNSEKVIDFLSRNKLSIGDIKLRAREKVIAQEERMNAAFSNDIVMGKVGSFVGGMAGDIAEAGRKATEGDVAHLVTYFIPGAGFVKGGKAIYNVARTVGIGAATGAATEFYLQTNDVKDFEEQFLLREQTAEDVLLSTAMGGVFGGAIPAVGYGTKALLSRSGRKANIENLESKIGAEQEEELNSSRLETEENIAKKKTKIFNQVKDREIRKNASALNSNLSKDERFLTKAKNRIAESLEQSKRGYFSFDERQEDALTRVSDDYTNNSLNISNKIKEQNNKTLKSLEDANIKLDSGDINIGEVENLNFYKNNGKSLKIENAVDAKILDPNTPLDTKKKLTKEQIQKIKDSQYVGKVEPEPVDLSKEIQTIKSKRGEDLKLYNSINDKVGKALSGIKTEKLSKSKTPEEFKKNFKDLKNKLNKLEDEILKDISGLNKDKNIYINNFKAFKKGVESNAKKIFPENEKSRNGYIKQKLNEAYGATNLETFSRKIDNEIKQANYYAKDSLLSGLKQSQIDLEIQKIKFSKSSYKKLFKDLNSQTEETLQFNKEDLLNRQNDINSIFNNKVFDNKRVSKDLNDLVENNVIPEDYASIKSREFVNRMVTIENIADEFNVKSEEMIIEQSKLLNAKIADMDFDISNINKDLVTNVMKDFFVNKIDKKVDKLIDNAIYKNEAKFLKDNKQDIIDAINSGASFEDVINTIISKINDINFKKEALKDFENKMLNKQKELDDVEVDTSKIKELKDITDEDKIKLEKADKIKKLLKDKNINLKSDEGENLIEELDRIDDESEQLELVDTCMLS